MKRCCTCKKYKTIKNFCKSKHNKDGHHPACKKCTAKQHADWYKRNCEKEKARVRKFNAEHKEVRKLYRARTFERRSKYMKKWRAKNKKHVLQYKNTYESARKKTDIGYRMLCNIRNRIRDAMKNDSKTSPTKVLLGCTIQELKQHLQSKFTDKMNWDNYGRKGWHIDHILPCASFDLSKPEEQKKCFHYTNLQPLWHIDNIMKSDKIIP